ncbi:MAG: SPOR domain-containing protein [Prevotella sp.]
MNGLEKHLEILLLHHDCVIVPGFGGFIAHHVVAKYDEQDGLFIPPMRILGFNPSLTSINDSLLAQSYIDTFDVSYPEALKMIEDEVSQLKASLYAEGSFKLASVGELKVNQEGRVEFYPDEYGIFSPSLYALPVIDIASIRLSANRPDPQESLQQETFREEQIEAVPQDTDTRDSDSVSIKKTWVGYAAAVALSLVLFVFMTDPISNSSGKVYVSQSPNETMMHLISNANNELKANRKAVTESVPAPKQEQMEAAPLSDNKTVKPAPIEKPYCIVLASKVSMKNAEFFVSQLKRQGIDSVEIYRNNNITRVVYGSYDSEVSAQSALRALRNMDVFKQSWVYRKKG